ncbi:MAG: hypothetical protein AB4041_10325 [Microcystaceae cyanobacterium]
MKILDPNQSYTFSKIFELKVNVDELVKDFGYTFSRKHLNLSQYKGALNRLQQLEERIIAILPNVLLSTEIARREILIAPVITDLVYYTNAQLRIEYSLKVSEQLQGSLDYFLHNPYHVIVIEAKKGDLDYGFNQLATQLIALDQWLDSQEIRLLGAVTTGNIWQFGCLNREDKHINQGLENYRVPEDLEPLMRILVQALTSSNS